ncbi:MAG: cell division protein ZapA [Desulfuromonadales bacterium]|nr:cell division protein ZapA [Desulfuromonadales bacterium]
MKQAVQVTILGQPCTIRSEAPPEQVRRVASFVNEQVAEVAASSRTVDTLNVAILTLMKLGSTLLHLQEGSREADLAANRLQQMVLRLEQALPELPKEAGAQSPR